MLDLSEHAKEEYILRDETRYCVDCESEVRDLEARGLDYVEENFDPRMTVSIAVYDREEDFSTIEDGETFYGQMLVYCEEHENIEQEFEGQLVRRGETVIPDYAGQGGTTAGYYWE